MRLFPGVAYHRHKCSLRLQMGTALFRSRGPDGVRSRVVKPEHPRSWLDEGDPGQVG